MTWPLLVRKCSVLSRPRSRSFQRLGRAVDVRFAA
jgi:hypothetical protein